MLGSEPLLAVDLGKSRCRIVRSDGGQTVRRDGVGTPGLAAPGGVDDAYDAIITQIDAVDDGRLVGVGVGAAGAWAAPDAATALAHRLASRLGAPVAVTSDVVTAHAGALAGRDGVLLIAGTGAVALGLDRDGARLIDGWGPELGDLGSGSWFGREALRAVLRTSVGLGPATVLADTVTEVTGPASAIPGWAAGEEPLARRMAALAPLVLDAASGGDDVALSIAAEAVRLLTASAIAASAGDADVALHGGLTEHPWFREALTASLAGSECAVVPAAGDALDGALLLARRDDLPHERFVHRAE
ncbi:N-acetylglucosamine kinase [Microbacterium hydrocarbonoxydans]|uniref:N-acetylglucosamine kinase n=1 Tax=Microbacterium hydrocarbonoxydans TaxID=273678 RepID=UPI0013DACEA8|nr:BadF/BadG/BcrA/BcrD ATPase family protein [Microbacterium hydrocarbonoxydans]